MHSPAFSRGSDWRRADTPFIQGRPTFNPSLVGIGGSVGVALDRRWPAGVSGHAELPGWRAQFGSNESSTPTQAFIRFIASPFGLLLRAAALGVDIMSSHATPNTCSD